jgi:hypothetical protein
MFFVSAKIYHSLCGAGTNGGSLRTGRWRPASEKDEVPKWGLQKTA